MNEQILQITQRFGIKAKKIVKEKSYHIINCGDSLKILKKHLITLTGLYFSTLSKSSFL